MVISVARCQIGNRSASWFPGSQEIDIESENDDAYEPRLGLQASARGALGALEL